MRHPLLTAMIIGILVLAATAPGYAASKPQAEFSLADLEQVPFPGEARELLQRNGFVVTPSAEDDIHDLYATCKKNNQPIFVTTDAVLHTCHIFFDYLLRILEIDQLYDLAEELTDRMLDLSIKQYQEAQNSDVKEAARLNIGYFAVAKRQFDPQYKVGYGLEQMVTQELKDIEEHSGLKFRQLLSYVEKPDLFLTPYAYEDYSQYIPRGHYTRNEAFQRYFKAMMWYGRIDFKLQPGESELAIAHGKKMTLQALLMTDAFLRDKATFRLWQRIYQPTTYFVGKTDDLHPDNYIRLVRKVFPAQGTVDRYAQQENLSRFIAQAFELKPPKILSGPAFVEHGEFPATTMGFRFMGQRYIPDSYMFQELVYGRKGDQEILKYTGTGKPFTMEYIPGVGPARAFPRGLDIFAVLGSPRALGILQQEGDTEYTHYHDQLKALQGEFSSESPQEWRQNLYWRWLYSLLPLLEETKGENIPGFMQSPAWLDKALQTTLGSWTELRHDTILYAKQSYTMLKMAAPQQPDFTYGYVEPYVAVYARIEEMMTDLRKQLVAMEIAPQGVSENIEQFERLLADLKTMAEKELQGQQLTQEEYQLIWNIGAKLASLKRFPPDIMERITSGTDEKLDLMADVHTDLNTGQVLEEGVGSPFNIYVIVDDGKGYRLCRGGIFSYYEFKHPMRDRLTDEQWQQMEKKGIRPAQPDWVKTFTAP